MPYITKIARDELGYERSPATAGELNYYLTRACLEYWQIHHSYQGINDIVGALEGCKLEFVRRVVNDYEDKKIEQNGDVY